MNAIVSTVNAVTMTSREIADLTGKDHGNVMRDIRAMVDAISTDSNLNPCAESTTYIGKDGRQYPQYELDKDTCLTLLLGYDAVARMKVVKRWQELEAKTATPAALSRMDILKLAMESEEARIKAEAERDHAIATKAQIGSRREATAMATAAAAKREAARLKDQLGFSARHATILQVEDAAGEDYDFVPLRRWCKAHEVTPETVPDKRYPKGVKAWPAAAWMDVYGVDLGALFAKDAGTDGGDVYAMGAGV